ncbi:hypothetical protein [Amycolatopsis sp. NPDC051061]|uniref:hypothetical protein n=1 Tax=Amycolatopsis sp. NPDC051061 TaxID=3155042 RepID=UPI0034261561
MDEPMEVIVSQTGRVRIHCGCAFVASNVGTTIGWYGFVPYVTIAAQIFPNPLSLAQPVGAAIFEHLGYGSAARPSARPPRSCSPCCGSCKAPGGGSVRMAGLP